MSLEDFHESSGESEDDDGVLNQGRQDSAASGQVDGDNGGDSSEASLVDPLDGQNEQSESSELQHGNNNHISLGGFINSASSASSKQSVPAFIPTDRSLPSKDVTDETLDDAYVAFVLYCNPSVPLDCDSTELRKAFRLPPKSDGKTFNVYELLQLIMKLEQKEIKTWTKLAIELGVERTPDQSAQKVQQYAVRLKRWMHAMHIDAFFEYCLGKAHPYYLQIPPVAPNGGLEDSRDGVPLEEDLALRALHPESRPKRGRRKTEDRNDDGSERDGAGPAAKRQQLDPPTPSTAGASSAVDPYHGGGGFPHSAAPSSADPDGLDRYMNDATTPDPWSAPSGSARANGQQYQWRAYSKEATTPHSALTPTLTLETPTDEPMTPTVTTPMSAGRSRPRRRHGPAVSSAWPSSGNPLTGKLRGRPPSNRSVRDGPFSTFPVNPSTPGKPGEPGTGVSGTPTSTPVVTSHPQQFPPAVSPGAANPRPQVRPQGLHLQVPPRKPSTVTMATPIAPQANGNPFKPDSATETLERAFAVNLFHGVNIDISRDDARKIARKAISDLRQPSWNQSQAVEAALINSLNVLLGCEGSTADMFKGFRIQRVSSTGLPEDLPKGAQATPGKYKLSWRLGFGPLKGEFTQYIHLGETGEKTSSGWDEDEDEDDGDDVGGFVRFSMANTSQQRQQQSNTHDAGRGQKVVNAGRTEVEWQAKYFEMEQRLREAEQRLREKEDDIAAIKRKVLNAVM